jgi:acyl carrier protein
MQTLFTTCFADRRRRELVDDPQARFVFLGNFEVEEHWARSYGRLPGAAVKSSAAVVNRMDEFGRSLATALDHVVLKDSVDVVAEDTRLFEDLNLDSTTVIELLMALEDVLGILVDPDTLEPKHFTTVGALADYVQSTDAPAQAA